MTTHGDVTIRHHRSTILTTLSAQHYLTFSSQHFPFTLSLRYNIYSMSPAHSAITARIRNTSQVFHIATLITTQNTQPPVLHNMFHIHVHRQQRHYYDYINDLLPQCLGLQRRELQQPGLRRSNYNDTVTIGLIQPQLLLSCRCRIWVSTRFHVRARCSLFCISQMCVREVPSRPCSLLCISQMCDREVLHIRACCSAFLR